MSDVVAQILALADPFISTLTIYVEVFIASFVRTILEIKASRSDFEWIVILFSTVLLLDVVNFLGFVTTINAAPRLTTAANLAGGVASGQRSPFVAKSRSGFR